ncbi:MAG: hypothetical protein KC964_22240 [Candidatus Omnitrophica bacterium]|nr:hypothetical protein [Candidatus Omnitrophota bacterium]
MSKSHDTLKGNISIPIGEYLAIEKTVSASIDLLAAIEERHYQFLPEIEKPVENLTQRLNKYRQVSQPHPDRIDMRFRKRKIAGKRNALN